MNCMGWCRLWISPGEDTIPFAGGRSHETCAGRVRTLWHADAAKRIREIRTLLLTGPKAESRV